MSTCAERVAAADWNHIVRDLDSHGCAHNSPTAEPTEARDVADLYDRDERFRSTIDMSRHRFGEGDYRYFDRPCDERSRRAPPPRRGRAEGASAG